MENLNIYYKIYGTMLNIDVLLGCFVIVTHIVIAPYHKIISIILHNCNFATLVNGNIINCVC